MRHSSNSLWRVFVLVVAFTIGSVCVLFFPFLASRGPSGSLHYTQPELTQSVHRDRNGNTSQNQNGNSSQDHAGHDPSKPDKNPNQNQNATGNQNQNDPKTNTKPEPVKLTPVKEPSSAPKLPVDIIMAWKPDQNVDGLRNFGVVENIPDLDVLDSYDASRLSTIYHSYLDNDDILCHRKLRMGKLGDGGWEICDDYEWRPIRPCVIYSFGIDYDFTFDDDAGKIYGCNVFSFDPSMNKQPTYQRSDRVMFYQLGLGAQSGHPEKLDNGWLLHSLSSLRTMLNHTQTVIDVLKMDVEGEEWSALPNMLQERQLNNVRQLLLEYHQNDDNAQTLRSRLKIIGDLQRAGFKKFYAHKNPACGRPALGMPVVRTSCYEVHYVNAKFRRDSDSTTPKN